MVKKTSPAPKSSPFDFEKAMAELEELVQRMEQGDLTLEQSLKDFERGIELTRGCQNALKEADQKVEILMEKAGQESLAPFAPDDD